jgi:hypothetical protein
MPSPEDSTLLAIFLSQDRTRHHTAMATASATHVAPWRALTAAAEAGAIASACACRVPPAQFRAAQEHAGECPMVQLSPHLRSLWEDGELTTDS